MRVILLRAKRTDTMFEEYDVYGWATNLYTHDMHPEKIIELYRGRGNAENFLRETKNNFDLKHFPCLKMIANKAYGLIGSYAHSIMRMMAYIENPFKPRFAKNLRLRTVRLACEVVHHARQTTVRFMHNQYKEVTVWLHKIHKLKVEVSLQL